MHIAIEDLKLDHLYVIFPGNMQFPLDANITAYGLDRINNLRLDVQKQNARFS